MNPIFYTSLLIIAFHFISITHVQSVIINQCSTIDKFKVDNFVEAIIPDLEGKTKGEAGKIGVIGGSAEYTGAPYFAAISALKAGADLVYVITTESAAPVIKSYSPDLIVYPFLTTNYAHKIQSLLLKMDVIIIGPGLGREDETLKMIYDILQTCKYLKKPLVVDADGLYAISKNVSVVKNYPKPGIILTPNQKEAKRLKEAVLSSDDWYNYWGEHVSVLVKGKEDQYKSNSLFKWSLSQGGSGRRAGGQGDILSGSLGTFYNWAIKSNLCENEFSIQIGKSVATYAAAKLTRICNFNAFTIHGRSLIASDMLNQIHFAFENLISEQQSLA